MSTFTFVEDLFLEFARCNSIHGFVGHPTDYRAVVNFTNIISNHESLTQSQANLILKILKKYIVQARTNNIDYGSLLDEPRWKHSFRILDLSKKIFVAKNEDNQVILCLKFPFGLKDSFLQFFGHKNSSHDLSSWDHEEKIRKINVKDVNLIHLYEWGKENGFEFDEKFLNLVFEAENAWENEDKITPHSIIFENQAVLMNSNQDADNFFEKHSTGDLYNDLFLAKSMNFPLENYSDFKHPIEKIAASKSNIFWIKENFDFFKVYEHVKGKICVILDRAASREDWLKKFIDDSEKFGVNRNEIKICFRDGKHDQGNFNQWIKEKGLGGNVSDGKLLIFEGKPAKWLFRDNVDVKIIVTNNLFSNSTLWVNDWMKSHPCVIFLSEHKPTLTKVKDIAVL